MNLYTFVVSFHVIVAILGLGPLFALALLTRRPPIPAGAPRPAPPEPALRAFLRLLRLSQVSLALMLTTGVILVVMVHGAFGRQLWMMASGILFLSLGAATGFAQSSFKKALTPDGSIVHVERAHKFLVATCLMLLLLVWLMEAKPF